MSHDVAIMAITYLAYRSVFVSRVSESFCFWSYGGVLGENASVCS